MKKIAPKRDLLALGAARGKAATMRILIVEDEKKLSDILQRSLKSEGYTVDGVHTAADGLEYMKTYHYDLIIIDLQLPDGTGTSLLKRLRELGHTMPALILTARSDWTARWRISRPAPTIMWSSRWRWPNSSIRVQALLRRGPALQENMLEPADWRSTA